MNKLHVSVLVPTYKRADLIGHVLEGLSNQTYPDFEVIVILKPSGDMTREIVARYKEVLNLKLIVQTKGYVTDAINLGLENADGDIIAFLDDDAIPHPNWIQNHVETYKKMSNVGGVAGNVLSATLEDAEALLVKEEASEILPNHYKPFLESIGRKIWSRPLEGLEDYLVYISKAGIVEKNYEISLRAQIYAVKSLLGMGANMSVLAQGIKGFSLPSNSWILGLAYEQYLGWHIWKQGYNLFFNPAAKVYHLAHGQTLSRNVKDIKKMCLRQVESGLLFYRLYGLETDLSNISRIAWLIFSTLVDIKKMCKNKEVERRIRIKSRLYCELIGLKLILSNKLRSKYDLLNDLRSVGGLR